MKIKRKKHYKIIYYNILTNEAVVSYDCDALPAKKKIKAVRSFCPKTCYGRLKMEMI